MCSWPALARRSAPEWDTDRPAEDRRQPGLHQVKPADYPIGRLGVHMVIRKAGRADDPAMLTVLGAPAREHDIVELALTLFSPYSGLL